MKSKVSMKHQYGACDAEVSYRHGHFRSPTFGFTWPSLHTHLSLYYIHAAYVTLRRFHFAMQSFPFFVGAICTPALPGPSLPYSCTQYGWFI